MTKPLHKAVIVLGFGPSDQPDATMPPGAGGSAGVRRAVQEALAAGLKELIFVTADSLTPVEAQLGDAGSGKAARVVIARQFAAGSLGEALCGVRHLLNEEPFMLLLPADLASCPEEGIAGRLVESYKENGGNLVALTDDGVLRRDGSFAAIGACPAGCYLLQPAVLDALEDDLEGGLAGALLTVAEAWPMTALPLRSRAAATRLQPLLPPSERPTVRGPRPVSVVAAREGGDWPGTAGL